MKKFNSVLTWVENVLASVPLAIAALLTITEVIGRTFFNYSIYWVHEAVIYLVIYSTFFGASIALRKNEHVGVDIVSFFLKENRKWILKLISMLIFLIYCVVVAFLGWIMITQPQIINTTTPSLKIPLWIVQLALPIGMTILTIRSLDIIYKILKNKGNINNSDLTNFDSGGGEY